MPIFSSNPLALAVPDPAFESWLRDAGYLDVLDDRHSQTLTPSTPSPSPSSRLRALLSLLALNPFANISPADLAAPTPPWTSAFVAGPGGYSVPVEPAQARMRVQENVRRYARNYTCLALVVLACSLYQMPKALVGLMACLVLWEGLLFCSGRWEMEKRMPSVRALLVYATQIATAVVLFYCNLQVAVLTAAGISYAVMLTHASLRKLSVSK